MKIAQKIAIGYVRARINMLAVISPALAADKAMELFSTPKYRSKKPPPEIFSKGERIHFLQNGKRVKGYRWNEGAGKKLLVLHGYESSCRKFDHHISRGIKKGYEVFAFDAPAHGSSEGKKINALDYAEMIRLAEKHFGKMDAFICHSFGGMALSLHMEKRPHDHHTRIVFIAPATETTTAIDGLFSFLQLNDKVRVAFDQKIKDLSGHPPSFFSIARAIKHINASILWVHDEGDQITPLRDVRKIIAAGHPNVEFMITKGLGHNKIYRDTEVKRKIFSFL
jgi:alpha-beta hydrolase superfamily lysophospholipase